MGASGFDDATAEDESGFEHHFNGTERVFPAKLNCTAKRFIDVVLSGVVRQLQLAGVADAPDTTLSFHLDAGRSQPEGGGRDVPASAETVRLSDRAAETNCTEAQVLACHQVTRGLSSLEGLATYLVDALEGGVANPNPGKSSAFGWGAVAAPILGSAANLPAQTESSSDSDKADEKPTLEVGGGSGAGFQIICDAKGLASAGGGGGGGAAGLFGDLAEPLPQGKTPLGPKDSIGGGGGGGVQFFLPIEAEAEPWSNGRWKTWGTGGGQGCGSCGDHDDQCKALNTSLACGAKFDEKGAGPDDVAVGRGKAHLWRTTVLRRCYETGRLAVIGGGGGGAGGSGCCRTTPSLNFGFGFHATLMPPGQEQTPATSSSSSASAARAVWSSADPGLDCCPDLSGWNITDSGQSTSGQGSANLVARRLSEVHSMESRSQADMARKALGGSFMNAGSTFANSSIDPFAAEHGHPQENIGGANRRPTVQEMIRMHGERNGIIQTNRAELEGLDGPRCEMPSWLQASKSNEPALPRAGGEAKESAEALRYIYRYNPLQGYLVEGAERCGGWGDWCCLCHSAQRHIACLPDDELRRVDWFLTEDCCESSIQRNLSSNMLVLTDTPHREETVAWRPGQGWTSLPRNSDGSVPSDSYVWDGEVGEPLRCPTAEVLLANPSANDFTSGPTRLTGLRGERAQPLGPATQVSQRLAALDEAPSSSQGYVTDVLLQPAVIVFFIFCGVVLLLPALRFFQRQNAGSWSSQRPSRNTRQCEELSELRPSSSNDERDACTPYCLMIA
mmetsp:Transcript_43368/g.102116  ORF Transcript_43368/g.102116 Transcript_43368/m.102116 type:complete len:788 (-) Transcript_43368:67-2430(-)